MTTKYYYFPDRSDGFGAQFQTLLCTILFCEYNKLNFVYKGIKNIEHNYENDPKYIDEIDELMNIKNCYNYENTMDKTNIIMLELPFNFIKIFNQNINKYLCSQALSNFKNNFWKNKNKNVFNNGKKNVAVHIRRYCTIFDIGYNRPNIPLEYYLNIMNIIRKKHNNDLLFHIYSLGSEENFKKLENSDVILHINENISKTFTELVAADFLIMSASSLSYVAAFLSDGEIYYLPFWHPPKNDWIVC
jgi:hypothetical protein